MPKSEVLITCGGGRERILGLGDGVAQEVAHIVLIQLRFKAKLTMVVEERSGCLQLDSVALLACEVVNRQ